MSDLMLRDVLIVDRTGHSPFQGDVALTGDRIEAVGKLSGNGTEIIDGTGLALVPGIIDSHTHYDHNHTNPHPRTTHPSTATSNETPDFNLATVS